jgi:hypothetical protein
LRGAGRRRRGAVSHGRLPGGCAPSSRGAGASGSRGQEPANCGQHGDNQWVGLTHTKFDQGIMLCTDTNHVANDRRAQAQLGTSAIGQVCSSLAPHDVGRSNAMKTGALFHVDLTVAGGFGVPRLVVFSSCPLSTVLGCCVGRVRGGTVQVVSLVPEPLVLGERHPACSPCAAAHAAWSVWGPHRLH